MGGRNIMGNEDYYVYAFSASDGSLLWQYLLNSPVHYWSLSSPALGLDGTLYVCSSGTHEISARLYAFFTSAAAPTAPILVSPINGDVDQPTFLSLEWEASLGAGMYHLQVSIDSLFTTNVLDDSTILIVPYKVDSLDYLTKYYWRVRAKNTAGTSGWSEVWNLTTVSTTGMKETQSFPYEFSLNQNYPNPFNSSTTICFSMPKSGFVTLKVFDLLGKEINILMSGKKAAGDYEVTWNAKDLPTGIYLYRLQAGEFVETKKLISA